MFPTPTPDPGRDDEVLTFLAWLEKFLWRMIEGIFVFFFHRIPKWTYQIIKGCVEHLWEYLERFIRIVIRLGRVLVLTGVLVAVIVGPGAGLYYASGPAALVVWIGLIVCALLFALQRRVWKEYQRRKKEKAARLGRQPVCGRCHTAHPGAVSPAVCSFCKEKWVDVRV